MKCKNCKQKDAVKYSKYTSGEFCSRECSRGYSTKSKRKEINKKVSKSLSDRCNIKKEYFYKCDKCKLDFENEKRLRKDRNKHCVKCRRKVIRIKNLDDIDSILSLSKRTVSKILKRAGICCVMCGWDKTSLDIHHIIPKKDKGNDSHDNLIAVCPNCHRMAHEGLYVLSELKRNSVSKMFLDWKKYYNIK